MIIVCLCSKYIRTIYYTQKEGNQGLNIDWIAKDIEKMNISKQQKILKNTFLAIFIVPKVSKACYKFPSIYYTIKLD